jgi:hypothetical protein
MDADVVYQWCAAIALISIYVFIVIALVLAALNLHPVFWFLLIPAAAGLVALTIKAKQELF